MNRRLVTEGYVPVKISSSPSPDGWSVTEELDSPVAIVSVIDESAVADGGADRVAGSVRVAFPAVPSRSETGILYSGDAGDRCAMGVASRRLGVSADRTVAVVELVHSVGDLCDSVEGKVCSIVTVPLSPGSSAPR